MVLLEDLMIKNDVFEYWQVVKFERQLLLSFVLKAFHQQTEELGFKDTLENAVVLFLVDDEEVVLQSAAEKQTESNL